VNEASTSSKTSGALIVGGAHGSLAMARSLGRAGIPVVYVTNDQAITKYSRYTTHAVHWLGPNQPGAAEQLIALARKLGLVGYVLFPGGDAEVRMVAQSHATLATTFRLMTPPWETTRWALDKKLTYARAAALDIDHPKSFYPANRRESAQIDCRFPVLVKPTTRFDNNAFTQAKAWRADDSAELVARFDQALVAASVDSISVQEIIPGNGDAQFSYAALWDRGKPLASLVARRRRQFPIDVGYCSTYVRTLECPAVEEASERLLQSLDYHGLVEVEYKFDHRDGRYKILDVNVRGWTWIALGARAGVDFPLLNWRLAMGEAVPAGQRGRAGAGWMLGSRDIVASCQEMLLGRLSPLDYLRSFALPLEFAVFNLDDPLPALVDLPLLAGRLLSRRLPMTAQQLARRVAS
jgi:predicted ATP-grasp superfamily ATP-dependent carboligase